MPIRGRAGRTRRLLLWAGRRGEFLASNAGSIRLLIARYDPVLERYYRKMNADPLVTIDLTDDEWKFMFHSIGEWLGPAHGQFLLLSMFALASKDEFSSMARRLSDACRNREPLTDLDWARALLLTEISWGSDLLGAGVDSVTNFRDEIAVDLLRAIQYKISNSERLRLLEIEAGIVATIETGFVF